MLQRPLESANWGGGWVRGLARGGQMALGFATALSGGPQGWVGMIGVCPGQESSGDSRKDSSLYRVPILVRRSALLVPVGAATTALARAAWDVPAALGARPSGERLERMRRSPRFHDGAFHNEVDARIAPAADTGNIMRDMVFGKEKRRPRLAVPLMAPSFDAPPLDGLRVTWLGHATALVEL